MFRQDLTVKLRKWQILLPLSACVIVIALQHAALTQTRGCLEGSYMDISESSCPEVAETTLISTFALLHVPLVCFTVLWALFSSVKYSCNTVFKSIDELTCSVDAAEQDSSCAHAAGLVTRMWYSVHGLCKRPGSFLNRKIGFVQLSLRKSSFSPRWTQVCWFSCL